MKVSVLTPTYNDSESIEETLQSLVQQTYDNWEWIVINDGSTDDTENKIKGLIKKYHIEDKCRYIYQENADQLNAIIHGTEYITGEYVFSLHSDDLLPDSHFFEKCVDYMQENPELDGIFGDLLLINEKSEVVGKQKVKEYRRGDSTSALMLLWLGRNLYSDVAFHRVSAYKGPVLENYLKWNMPLWINLSGDKAQMLNYKNVTYPVLKYRVHQGNYINNDLGKMNVINGELRTAAELMRFYTIPHYKAQYIKYRLMNKIAPNRVFELKFNSRETEEKYPIIKFIIEKRYAQGVQDNNFLQSILEFYRKKTERTLSISVVPEGLTIYYGKDVRAFNKSLLSETLEPFYIQFMSEMKKGFSCVHVKNERDVLIMKDILKFFCIGHIDVRCEE